MKKQRIQYITYCFIISLLSLISLPGAAQEQELVEKVTAHFNVFNTYKQEKLYLHLDKPYYAAGENIYWKAYLTEAVTHTSNALSNFIYVELIDENDHVAIRKKIKRDTDGFQGNLELQADIPAGKYYIRAYTQWMQNVGEEFFYSRLVNIGNALDRYILSSINYDTSGDDKDCQVTISFTDETQKPMSGITIAGNLVEKGKKNNGFSRKTNDQGEILLNIPINKEYNERSIEVRFKDKVYDYSRTFYVPVLGKEENSISLSFHPEGGELISNCMQKVVFKALKADGTPCDLRGFVLNEQNDTITTFQTEHDGMGLLIIHPEAGKKYTAYASRNDLPYQSFTFPDIKAQGKQLSMMQRKDALIYNILSTEEIQPTDTLYLIGHTRGRLFLISSITSKNTSGKLSRDMMIEGVSEFLLADKQGNVLSRRLIFKAPETQLDLSINTLPDFSGRRKKIEIPVRVTDKQGNPIQGSFSVSVTDKHLVKPDSTAPGISSYFLLTSDLREYIERPDYYFSTPSTTVDYYTDMLMITQQWKRFSYNNLTALPPVPLQYYIEGGQTIAGKVVNLFGKRVKKTPVALFAPEQNLTSITESDENGHFLFDNLNFKNQLTFVAQSKNKRGFTGAFLKIDSVSFPQPYNKFPKVTEGEVSENQDYDLTVRNSYLDNGGMQVIRLKEVTVTAKRKETENLGMYYGMGDTAFSEDDLEKYGDITAEQLLMRLPGIHQVGNDIKLMRHNMAPLYIIDDLRYEDGQEFLSTIFASDIKFIEIAKGASASFFGPEAAGGAIIIKLKDGTEIKREASPGLALFSVLGYADSTEFHHPTYASQQEIDSEKRDIRTTVYWNPNLKTDQHGNAVIEFYTPDNLIDPFLQIESILQDGRILSFSR